jgi:hypothetical protein
MTRTRIIPPVNNTDSINARGKQQAITGALLLRFGMHGNTN